MRRRRLCPDSRSEVVTQSEGPLRATDNLARMTVGQVDCVSAQRRDRRSRDLATGNQNHVAYLPDPNKRPTTGIARTTAPYAALACGSSPDDRRRTAWDTH